MSKHSSRRYGRTHRYGAAALVLGLASCGSSRVVSTNAAPPTSTAIVVTGAGVISTQASTAAPGSTSSSRFTRVEPLAEAVAYGRTLLSPPPFGATPKLTSDQAIAVLDKAPAYQKERKERKETMPLGELAIDTDYSLNRAGAAPRLVWAIIYKNIPDVASLPAPAPGQTAGTPQIEIHDLVAIIDANTGAPIDFMSAAPGAAASASAPDAQPPDGPPAPATTTQA